MHLEADTACEIITFPAASRFSMLFAEIWFAVGLWPGFFYADFVNINLYSEALLGAIADNLSKMGIDSYGKVN